MDRLEQLRQRVLVLKCQVGDKPAWDELYRRFNPALGYYLRRLTGSDSADDLQQEVWLAVVRNIARLKSPEAFAVWLWRIARSKAMDRLGRQHRHVTLDEQSTDVPDTSDDEFSPQDAAAVHAALDKLRPDHRDVLLLRFMEDLSYEQIAQVIGCTVGTVRSRLHYAKSALRRQLENTNA